MSAWLVHDEFRAMRARFHRALAISCGAHALLALGLLLAHQARPVPPRIVEVTWLEPTPASPAPLAPAPVRRAEAPPRPAPTVEPVGRPRPRDGRAAPTAVQADDTAARRDRQLAELAATRPALGSDPGPAPAATRAALATAPVGAGDLRRLAAATMAPVVAAMPAAAKGRPAALARGDGAAGPALALTRGPAAAGSALGTAAGGGLGAGFGGAPGPGGAGPGSGGQAAGVADAVAGGGAAGPGAEDILLEGPASERPVVASTLPDYPDWARRQAVEAAVTLHFTVLPDGRVREDVQVLRTAGFSDFDERAAAALRRWRFAASAEGEAAGQWGTITFHFRLRG